MISEENIICDIDGQYCRDTNCPDCPNKEDTQKSSKEGK